MISLMSIGIAVKVTVMKKRVMMRKSVSRINKNQTKNQTNIFKTNHFGKILKAKEPQDI